MPDGASEPDRDQRLDDPPTAAGGSVFWSLGTAGSGARSGGGSRDRIGRYEIKELLGQGGMGQVFLAEQVEPVRRLVALKIIRRGMDTREVVARFESERQTLALMSHPSIARVLDAGAAEDGSPYFVMEYVPGATIVKHCEERRLDTNARLDLFVRVCEAIQHAHQKAVIHRDIKPSNVLVTDVDGVPVPKVIDFGIAKAIGPGRLDGTTLTAMGQVIGTPEYMSPEQAGLNELDIDTRTDIYSLGVLLYELLTGAVPFDPKRLRDGGYANLLRTICEEVPVKPSTRVAGRTATDRHAGPTEGSRLPTVRELRGDLDWITMKALEKDRTRRYPSASELAADIRRHQRFEPVLAGPPGLGYRLRKLARKHRDKVIAGCALILVLAAYLVHDRRQDIAAARSLLAAGETSAARFAAALDVRRSVAAEFDQLREETPLWLPVWEREAESRLLERLDQVTAEIDHNYFDALESLEKARQAAPRRSSVSASIDRAREDLMWRQWLEAQERGQVQLSAQFFQRELEAMNLGTHARELAGHGELELMTDPPGAEVHCFRYEELERRLVPLAFDARQASSDPARGVIGRPFLRVERVWGPKAAPLQQGDRVLRINGADAPTLGALAAALEGVAAETAVPVELERSGSALRADWTPFPAAFYSGRGTLRPGKLHDVRAQLDLTFEAYPLEPLAEARAGSTNGERPLKLALPRGSYLLLIRRPGYVDLRLPVAVPRGLDSPTVRLHRNEDVPPGFLPVAAGSYQYGGDDEAYVSRPKGAESIGDFFIARSEVTCAEYLAFLNDKAARGLLDAEDRAAYEADWTSADLKELFPAAGPDRAGVLLLPMAFAREATLIRRRSSGDGFELSQPAYAELPIAGISMMAAAEYAHWLTARHGGRWRFRLPRDGDWEKAARGADRRPYVWGRHLVRTFVKEGKAHRPDRAQTLEPCNAFATDESVYGVRDLGGSVAEPTTVKALPEQQLYVYRGGYWTATDDRDLRAASRNRTLPWKRARELGIRLIAEPR